MTQKKVKTPRNLERYFKAVANHRRIHILMLVAKRPCISLEQIAEDMRGNIKTTAEHTRRLALGGLIEKKYAGRTVQHELTPYGRVFYDFIRTFSHS